MMSRSFTSNPKWSCTVNLEHTLTFLQCLEPDYQNHEFYWSGIHPDKQHNPARIQAYGTVEEMMPMLAERNAEGFGIFTTVNAMLPNYENGYARRRKTDVQRVRAVVADWDKPKEGLPDLPLPPSMMIRTSPGKYHFYWCTDDMPLEMFEQVQRGIVASLGSDPTIIDLSREMRVPGFMHTKDPTNPRMVELLECDGMRYQASMLADAFPFELKPKHHEAWDGTVRTKSSLTEAVVAACYDKKADGGKAYAVPCPWADQHTTDSTKTSTAYYPPSEENGGAGYFKCMHAHCAERTAAEYDNWIAARVATSLK